MLQIIPMRASIVASLLLLGVLLSSRTTARTLQQLQVIDLDATTMLPLAEDRSADLMAEKSSLHSVFNPIAVMEAKEANAKMARAETLQDIEISGGLP